MQRADTVSGTVNHGGRLRWSAPWVWKLLQCGNFNKYAARVALFSSGVIRGSLAEEKLSEVCFNARVMQALFQNVKFAHKEWFQKCRSPNCSLTAVSSFLPSLTNLIIRDRLCEESDSWGSLSVTVLCSGSACGWKRVYDYSKTNHCSTSAGWRQRSFASNPHFLFAIEEVWSEYLCFI